MAVIGDSMEGYNIAINSYGMGAFDNIKWDRRKPNSPRNPKRPSKVQLHLLRTGQVVHKRNQYNAQGVQQIKAEIGLPAQEPRERS